MFRAVEQLGLKFDSRKEQIETLVILGEALIFSAPDSGSPNRGDPPDPRATARRNV
jgi:hypothetical protein